MSSPQISTQLEILFERVYMNVPATIDSFIDDGINFGATEDEVTANREIVADYVWELLRGFKANDRASFQTTADQLCNLIIRGMEASEGKQ